MRERELEKDGDIKGYVQMSREFLSEKKEKGRHFKSSFFF